MQCVGMLGRPRRFDSDQLSIEGYRDTAGDLVFHGKQIVRGAVEPVRLEVRVSLGIDQLGVDSEQAGRPPNASLQYVTDPELPSDLLCVDRPLTIGEGGIAGDDEQPRDTR